MPRRKRTKVELDAARARRFEKKMREKELLKKQRRERKKQATAIVLQTKNDLMKGKSSKLTQVNEDLTEVFRPINLVPVVKDEQVGRVDQSEMSRMTSASLAQLDELTARIQVLESEQIILTDSILKLEKLAKDWREELFLTRQLVNMDYKIIYESEQELAIIEQSEPAKNWRDALFSFFNPIPNKYVASRKIANSEISFLNRQDELLTIQESMADVLITLRVKRELYGNLQKVANSYRQTRYQIGENFRALRKAFRDRDIRKDTALINQKIAESVKLANESLELCLDRLNSSQEFLKKKCYEFDQFQKNALKVGRNEIDQSNFQIQMNIFEELLQDID